MKTSFLFSILLLFSSACYSEIDPNTFYTADSATASTCPKQFIPSGGYKYHEIRAELTNIIGKTCIVKNSNWASNTVYTVVGTNLYESKYGPIADITVTEQYVGSTSGVLEDPHDSETMVIQFYRVGCSDAYEYDQASNRCKPIECDGTAHGQIFSFGIGTLEVDRGCFGSCIWELTPNTWVNSAYDPDTTQHVKIEPFGYYNQTTEVCSSSVDYGNGGDNSGVGGEVTDTQLNQTAEEILAQLKINAGNNVGTLPSEIEEKIDEMISKMSDANEKNPDKQSHEQQQTTLFRNSAMNMMAKIFGELSGASPQVSLNELRRLNQTSRNSELELKKIRKATRDNVYRTTVLDDTISDGFEGSNQRLDGILAALISEGNGSGGGNGNGSGSGDGEYIDQLDDIEDALDGIGEALDIDQDLHTPTGQLDMLGTDANSEGYFIKAGSGAQLQGDIDGLELERSQLLADIKKLISVDIGAFNNGQYEDHTLTLNVAGRSVSQTSAVFGALVANSNIIQSAILLMAAIWGLFILARSV